ncbi:MAG: biotin/lipoyl-containing protein [Polyangiaceae bacterium]
MKVDGRPVDVDVVDLREQLSVRVAGRMVDLTVEGRPPEVGAIANGQRAYVRVVSERERAAEAAKGKGPSAAESSVRSPMPGRIVKILVAKGAAVTKGQPLLVVEAMKMENEVKAKADATVADVHVTVGQTVEANAKLLSLA